MIAVTGRHNLLSTPKSRARARDHAATLGAVESSVAAYAAEFRARVSEHPATPLAAVATFYGSIFAAVELIESIKL